MRNNIVKVMLWGDEVGQLYWDDRSNRAIFNYNPAFVKKGIDIAPLRASVKGPAGRGIPVTGNRDSLYKGLPEFIADSLPDRWGNQLFDHWAAQNRIPLRTLSAVDRLAFIGKRGMGVLEFVPATSNLDNVTSIQINSLYLLAKQIFDEREQAVVLPEESLTLQSLYEVGTSAGGQHPKAIIAINEESHDIRSGQVELPEGYTYYLLKFAEGNDFPFTNVEMAYYEIAVEAGINMMPSKLINVEGKWHFLTERYDRVKGMKVHTQTLAAMNPDACSYEDLFEVCRKLKISVTEQTELFRRTVFNMLAANVDDHIKNFSFMMDRDGSWHITPAYDLTFTTNLDGAAYENVHSLTLLGKRSDITVADLVQFAKMNSIKGEKAIINQVATAIAHFYCYAKKHAVNEYWADRMEQHLSELVPDSFAESMQNHKPTVVEPYTTSDDFSVEDVNIIETSKHDFRIVATINGKHQKYIAGRKSELASEIIEKGRNKMAVEQKKKLVEKYLLPLARRDKK